MVKWQGTVTTPDFRGVLNKIWQLKHQGLRNSEFLDGVGL